MRKMVLIRVWLFALLVLLMSATSSAQISVAIRIGPPALPVYEQPPCPAEGYIWTPGYWAYNYDYNDYYWVPGTWVLAPEPGYLWTPAYWGWGGDRFIFHEGYWGPHVGFYGGIVYGFGYFGHGYEGGRWDHGRFFYNRSVNNINVTNIHNVYNTTVINNVTVNRISYNGGNGGINARPSVEEERDQHERHIAPVAVQMRHMEDARGNPQLRESVNRGRPPVAATPRPGEFNDRAVVPAREAGGPYRPPAERAGGQPNVGTPEPRFHASPAIHANDLPPRERPAPPNTGNPQRDQKFQRDDDRLFQKQEQERQKLEQRQEKDHQKLQQQRADDAKKQQIEQKHQQQTQQLEQKHEQQWQKVQKKQSPPNRGQSTPPGR